MRNYKNKNIKRSDYMEKAINESEIKFRKNIWKEENDMDIESKYTQVVLWDAKPVFIGTFNNGYFKDKKYIVFEHNFCDYDLEYEGTPEKRIFDIVQGRMLGTLNDLCSIDYYRYRVPVDMLGAQMGQFTTLVNKTLGALIDVKYTYLCNGEVEENWETIKVSVEELELLFE